MAADTKKNPVECNCLAVRQAARHVTQIYDRHMVPYGLRTTQFSMLVRLRQLGPMTINALAEDMVMDRTTLGRNILPLQREGLIAVSRGREDRRARELHLTEAGLSRMRAGLKGWQAAQGEFEAAFGKSRAADLRGLMRDVVAI
jgi:DNA-binding MarR family transcriptional regulator